LKQGRPGLPIELEEIEGFISSFKFQVFDRSLGATNNVVSFISDRADRESLSPTWCILVINFQAGFVCQEFIHMSQDKG